MVSTRSLSHWCVVFLCLLPACVLLYFYWFDPRRLGVDATEVLIQETGQWAIRFLILTLACSTLRRLGVKAVSRFRKTLGLTVFGYASLHMYLYVAAWLNWDLQIFLEDVITRSFIYLGALAWFFLFVLALSSPNRMKKKLKQNWVLLHRLIYGVAILVWVHLWMQSRSSWVDALVYGVLLGMLLVERLFRWIKKGRVH